MIDKYYVEVLVGDYDFMNEYIKVYVTSLTDSYESDKIVLIDFLRTSDTEDLYDLKRYKHVDVIAADEIDLNAIEDAINMDSYMLVLVGMVRLIEEGVISNEVFKNILSMYNGVEAILTAEYVPDWLYPLTANIINVPYIDYSDYTFL